MSFEEAQPEERRLLIQQGIEYQQDEITQLGAAVTAAEAQAVATSATDEDLDNVLGINKAVSEVYSNAQAILAAIKGSVITNTTQNVAKLKDELALVSLMQEQRLEAIEKSSASASATDAAHSNRNAAWMAAVSLSEQASDTYVRAVSQDSSLATQSRQHSARVDNTPGDYFIEEDPLDENPLANRVAKILEESQTSTGNRDKLARLLVEMGELTLKLGEVAREAEACILEDKKKAAAVRYLGERTCEAAQTSSEQATSLIPTLEEYARGAQAVIETAEQTAGEIH